MLVLTALPTGTWAQSPQPAAPILTVSRLGSLGAAAGVFWLPHLAGLDRNDPSCAPCNPDRLPGFDRWIVGPERDGWSAASTVTVLALAGATWIAEYRGARGVHGVAASVEAASWAAAGAELAKALLGRNRPVLYTADAPAAAARPDSHRSMPSTHTAVAFALATSYALHQREPPPWTRAAVLLAATGVGAMRVAARRHFPSDVVAGAALGVASAVVVHEIRF